MYESLKEWCVFPVKLCHVSSKSMSGDVSYSEPVLEYCYRTADVKTITDKTGKQYISSAQLYFKEDSSVSISDLIILPESNTEQEIRAINVYFDATTCTKSISVVYL